MKLSGCTQISYQQVQKLIAHHLNYVYFPRHIEKIYRQHYHQEVVRELRIRAPIVFILYSFLTFGLYKVSLEEQLSNDWLETYVWVGILTIAVWLLSWCSRFNRYFDWYAGFAAVGAVTLTFMMIAKLNPVENHALFHVAMMYAVIIIYSFIGLRFYTALLAGWLGGLFTVSVCHWLDYQIDWLVLNRSYIFTSFLGMALCYALDRQNRANFLQNCLIQLNQSKLLQQAELLEALSRHDALTGLANRRYLEEVLTREWRSAQHYQTPLSLMMLDIDYFKHYNDCFGHIAGDECLRQLATVLTNQTQRSHELAARYGGEEFMLVLPMRTLQQAEHMAQNLLKQVRHLALPHPRSPVSSMLSISIGVVNIVPSPQATLSDFIIQADQALYQAKKYGRNQYAVVAL